MRINLARYQAQWRQLRGVAGLAAITWAMITAVPHPGTSGTGAVTYAGIALATAGWLAVLFLDERPGVVAGGLLACATAGVVLTVSSPHSVAAGYLAAVCVYGGFALRPAWSAALTGAALTGYVLGQLALHVSPVRTAAITAVLVVMLLGGVIRRQVDERAEQNQLLLAEAQHAREEQARSAALAERARIAREIHDVLAHSLSALSVQLETVDALLESDQPHRARTTLRRARLLVRDGITETRRAISALRGDMPPLPDAIAALAEAYSADTGHPADCTVTGEPVQLPADTVLALYRCAQEALTNVRRHATGASVVLRLAYRPEEVSLTVSDTGMPAGEPDHRSVADRVPIQRPDGHQPSRDGERHAPARPAGYGLTGLRERAALAGGTVAAGPSGPGWTVDVRIPR